MLRVVLPLGTTAGSQPSHDAFYVAPFHQAKRTVGRVLVLYWRSIVSWSAGGCFPGSGPELPSSAQCATGKPLLVEARKLAHKQKPGADSFCHPSLSLCVLIPCLHIPCLPQAHANERAHANESIDTVAKELAGFAQTLSHERSAS